MTASFTRACWIGPRRGWALLCMVALGGCGRFLGFEYQPLPEDDADAGVEPDCEDDRDDDGTPDCADRCPDDPDKVKRGKCGCGVEEAGGDMDHDGIVDCRDTCGGVDDSGYVPDDDCGEGYCRTHNTASMCEDGKEIDCVPGEPLSSNDATCDGVDDDCDGEVDEDFVPVASCGTGVCAATSKPSTCVDGRETACEPGRPAEDDNDDNGEDDDCDGAIDEDFCARPTETYAYDGAVHTLVPPDRCRTLTVTLWGGAGAAGGREGGEWGLETFGGNGGAGGYAQETFSVGSDSIVELLLGEGGACGGSNQAPDGGANPRNSYAGGSAGVAPGELGEDGADGSAAGGIGGSQERGGTGGAGSLGGGGGGAGGDLGYGGHDSGGGGGAASALTVDSMRVLLAGGGGGGGGAGSWLTTLGFSGGAGGAGCAQRGLSETISGGGGGGGGVCEGEVTMAGVGAVPHDPDGLLPAGAATGGNGSERCTEGGGGYAVLQWGP